MIRLLDWTNVSTQKTAQSLVNRLPDYIFFQRLRESPTSVNVFSLSHFIYRTAAEYLDDFAPSSLPSHFMRDSPFSKSISIAAGFSLFFICIFLIVTGASQYVLQFANFNAYSNSHTKRAYNKLVNIIASWTVKNEREQ